jgi:hypothetical protein
MSLRSHVSTASGQKVLVAEGGRLVFGRGPGVDLIIAAGRGLSRRAGLVTAMADGAWIANISRTHALYVEGDGYQVRLPRMEHDGEPANGWFVHAGTALVGSRAMLDEGQSLVVTVTGQYDATARSQGWDDGAELADAELASAAAELAEAGAGAELAGTGAELAGAGAARGGSARAGAVRAGAGRGGAGAGADAGRGGAEAGAGAVRAGAGAGRAGAGAGAGRAGAGAGRGGNEAARGGKRVGGTGLADEGECTDEVAAARAAGQHEGQPEAARAAGSAEADAGLEAAGSAGVSQGGDGTLLPFYLDPMTKLFLVALIWCRPWLDDPSATRPLPRTPEIARGALEVTGAYHELERFDGDPEYRDLLSARVAEHIKVLRRKIADRGLAAADVRLSDEVAVRILIEHGIITSADLSRLDDPAWRSRQEDLWWTQS